MGAADLSAVLDTAGRVHPAYPEDAEVFAERLRLHPPGCLVLMRQGRLAGYAISHPWRAGRPPALNSLLGTLPPAPDTYYLHDLALLPEARGSGAASAFIEVLLACAREAKLAQLSLVAVNHSASFWQRHGFGAVEDMALQEQLRTYDSAACLMVRPLR